MNTKQTTKTWSLNHLLLIPVILCAGLIPLIISYIQYIGNCSDFTWSSSLADSEDYFMYWKGQTFFVLTIVMLCITIIYCATNRSQLKLHKKEYPSYFIFIPLILYEVFVLFSAFGSDYSAIVQKGMDGQFQSVYSLLGYGLIVFYLLLIIKEEHQLQFLLDISMIFFAVMSVFVILQAAGINILNSSLIRNLTISKELQETMIGTINEENEFILTLSNIDQAAAYVGMILPLSLILTLHQIWLIKNIKKKKEPITISVLLRTILYLFVFISMAIAFFNAKSDVSIPVIFLTTIVGIIILIKQLKKIGMRIIGVIAVLFIFCIFFFMGNPSVFERMKESISVKPISAALESIETLEDKVVITVNGYSFSVTYNYDTSSEIFSFTILDEDGTDITHLYNTDTATFKDERFSMVQFDPVLYDNVVCIGITIEETLWCFTHEVEDGTYYYVNRFGRYDKLTNSATFSPLSGKETLFNKRGYIWGKTIPLLKETFFTGMGPGTFTIAFPQQNYVENSLYFPDTTISQAQNMYLQTAIETGISSMLCLILFFIWYVIKGLKTYFTHFFVSWKDWAGFACFLASISYLASTLFLDSNIATAPLFWVILGTSLSSMFLKKKQKKIEQPEKEEDFI